MAHRIGRRALLLAAGAPALPGLARAQAGWPERPVRVIVPFAPGGITDSTARALSDALGTALGQPIVVENRAGGGAVIGAQAVAGARADGYTFLFDGHPTVTNPLLMRDLPFDYATAFTPVTQVARAPLAIAVRSGLPVANLMEFVALARSRPGEISCGHSGTGSGGQLGFLLLQQTAGIRLNEIPYRGGGDAVRDLAANQLDCVVVGLIPMLPLAQAGRARILAVPGRARSPAAPDVPTAVEAGLAGNVLDEWLGFFAPSGTPAPILEKLQGAVAAALRAPEVQSRFAALGNEAVGNSPAEFSAFLRERSTLVAGILRSAGIEPR